MFKKLLVLICCLLIAKNDVAMERLPGIKTAAYGALGASLGYLASRNCKQGKMLYAMAFGSMLGISLRFRDSAFMKNLLSRDNLDVKKKIAKKLARAGAVEIGGLLALNALRKKSLPQVKEIAGQITILSAFYPIFIMLAAALKIHPTLLHDVKDLETIEYWIAFGAPVNGRDSCGKTPLHRAVERGHKEMVAFLLKHGADVTAQDNDGATPLDIAVSRNKKDIIRILICESFFPPMLPSIMNTAEQSLQATCLMTALKNPNTYKNLKNTFPSLGLWSFDILASRGSLSLQQEIAQIWDQQKNYGQLTSFLTAHGNRHLANIQRIIPAQDVVQQPHKHQNMVRLLDQISRAQHFGDLDEGLQRSMIGNFKERFAVS